MRWLQYAGLCSVLGFTLAGCGGANNHNQDPRISYARLVTFGDSVSDVGTYAVSTIADIGGGKFTVNSGGGENWTEQLAVQLGIEAPCPAVTGIESVIAQIPAVAVTVHNGCYNYAMGGARVTNPVGPGNLALWTNAGVSSGQLGQMTYPISTQIDNFLASEGGFNRSDLVTVQSGGNDLLMELNAVAATTETVSEALANMATAGAELATYVKTKMVANGAEHVVVINLPDISLTPKGLAESALAQQLIVAAVQAYNNALADGLADAGDSVLLVDAYTQSISQHNNPELFGLTNVTTPACDVTNSRGQTTLAALMLAAIPIALLCSTDTTLDTDVSHYGFSDNLHPTPYGYKLYADQVLEAMEQQGWMPFGAAGQSFIPN